MRPVTQQVEIAGTLEHWEALEQRPRGVIVLRIHDRASVTL